MKNLHSNLWTVISWGTSNKSEFSAIPAEKWGRADLEIQVMLDIMPPGGHNRLMIRLAPGTGACILTKTASDTIPGISPEYFRLVA